MISVVNATGDESPVPERPEDMDERPSKRRRGSNDEAEEEASNEEDEEEDEEEEEEDEEDEEDEEEEDDDEDAEAHEQAEDEIENEEEDEEEETEAVEKEEEENVESDEHMPQVEANDEEGHWDDEGLGEKIDSTNDQQDSNDSAMDVDSPSTSNELKKDSIVENGYGEHQANGDASSGNHIKLETEENEHLLNEDSIKVNGADSGQDGRLIVDSNMQIFEDAKVIHPLKMVLHTY